MELAEKYATFYVTKKVRQYLYPLGHMRVLPPFFGVYHMASFSSQFFIPIAINGLDFTCKKIRYDKLEKCYK